MKEHMDTITPIRLNLDKPNWGELSQLFSFTTSATSPAQVRHQHLLACLISNQLSSFSWDLLPIYLYLEPQFLKVLCQHRFVSR